MIAGIGILLWTSLFLGLTHLLWKSIKGYSKVYLLIVCSALFLIGVFILFPYLKGIGAARDPDFKKSPRHGVISTLRRTV